MTDRELAGCAEVRRYYHSQDGFSTMELDSDGEEVRGAAESHPQQ